MDRNRTAASAMSRRDFVLAAAGGAALLGFGMMGLQGCGGDKPGKPFGLPELPYPENALKAVISKKTVSIHYGKHHRGYVEKTNRLVQGTSFKRMPLEEVIVQTAGSERNRKIFQNASQAWNHTFYWNSMKPDGGGEPKGEMEARIKDAFGSYKRFRQEFVDAALGRFASGWAWLVEADGKLAIVTTPNAGNPLVHGQTPLLTVDLWEHAYYLDFQNERQKYVEGVLDKLINWEFAEMNLLRMEAGTAGVTEEKPAKPEKPAKTGEHTAPGHEAGTGEHAAIHEHAAEKEHVPAETHEPAAEHGAAHEEHAPPAGEGHHGAEGEHH